MPRKINRICLAYSGGLDTSVILHWLIDRYECQVVAYTADVGQEEELTGLPEKARQTGARDCIVRDLREGDQGFAALASPVEVDEGRVGVVILLFEETSDESFKGVRREIQEPLDEITACLVAFSSATGGRRSDEDRIMIAEGLRAIARIRK